METLDAHEAKKMYAIKNEYRKDMEQMQKTLNPLDEETKRLTSRYNEEETYYHAEVNGIKEMRVGGKVIKASGKPSEGKRAKMHKASMQQIQREINAIRAKKVPLLRRMQSRENEYRQAKANMEKQHQHKAEKLEVQKRLYHAQMQQSLRANADEMRTQYKAQLTRVQKRLKELTLHKEDMIQKMYQKMMQSPEYIPFRDGPMSRVMALKKLENDPQYGEDVALVSWIVRGFIIFLEAIPIFSKMWFGPQTLYATLLQMRLKRMTQEAIDSEGLTLEDLDNAIALEKKKKELQDMKMQTWVSEVFEEDITKNTRSEMHKPMQGFTVDNTQQHRGEAA